MSRKPQLTADRVQAEYEKCVQYNTGLGLYENVKQCENFVEGKQWEGLKSKNLRPITMNVLDPIVHYKVAQIVSNDVDQEVEPFLPDEQAEYAAKILEQSIDRVVERTKLKSKHHMVLRDACVDGDAALYFYFDASKQSGFGGVQGEICAEQVMNTNILFGNPSNSNVQEQPYLIIVRRRPVSEIRKDAKRLGCKEWETIEGESDGLYKGDDEQNNSDSLGNEACAVLEIRRRPRALLPLLRARDDRAGCCNRNVIVSGRVHELEAAQELLSRRDGDQTAHQYAD